MPGSAIFLEGFHVTAFSSNLQVLDICLENCQTIEKREGFLEIFQDVIFDLYLPLSAALCISLKHILT